MKHSASAESALPANEAVIGANLLRRGVPIALRAREKERDGNGRDQLLVGRDRRQRRRTVAAVLDVVEPDDRHVVGDPDAPLRQDPKRPKGKKIVEAKHGVRALGEVEQPYHGLGPIRAVKLCGRHDELVVNGEVVISQAPAVTLEPKLCRRIRLPQLCADCGNAVPTEFRQRGGQLILDMAQTGAS